MMKSVTIFAISFGFAATAGAATPPSSAFMKSLRPDAPPQLGEAYLGMSLAAWKAMPRSPALSPRAAPSCAEAAKEETGAKKGQRSSALQDLIVCSYRARYGSVALTQAVPLTSGYLARDPQYIFTNGRLSAIRFVTSIDAFNLLTARFSQAYGPPESVLRDKLLVGGVMSLPRVREIWTDKDRSLRITDPSSRPDRLEVELAARPPANLNANRGDPDADAPPS